MQINSKGEIVNAPQYQVSGLERRKLKKKLSSLKFLAKMFWRMEDVNRTYGCGMSDQEAEEYLSKLNEEIKRMEDLLTQHK